MINAGEMKQIILDAQEDPEYIKADEAYFKSLLEGVTEKIG